MTSDGGRGDRYSRQARFWGVGEAGQRRLAGRRVVVVGCGALGSAAVELLARGGIGRVDIVDRDLVELSNLQRQILFDEEDARAGLPKAVAAARAAARLNSEIQLEPRVADVTPANVERLVAGADAVVDGTDNFETRYLLNDACVKLGIPWVHGAAIGSTGVVMTIVPGETPCFCCAFPERPMSGATATCETAGILGSTVLVVAALQWTEVLKLLVGDRAHRADGVTAVDLWTHDFERAAGVPRRPDCRCCGARRFDYLEARATARTATLCGRDAVQVSPAQPVQLDLAALGERLAAAGTVRVNPYLLRFTVGPHELTVFDDARAIVKGTGDPAVARSLYARYVGV